MNVVKAGTGKKFPRVARGVAQSIVDKELVDAEYDPPIGSVVAGPEIPVKKTKGNHHDKPVGGAVGAELNSGDALAGLGISSPVAPVYGGIKRLPSTGPQCMFCGGLNGLHQKDCQREKGKKK